MQLSNMKLLLLLTCIYCTIFPELHTLLWGLPIIRGYTLAAGHKSEMHNSNSKTAFTCPIPLLGSGLRVRIPRSESRCQSGWTPIQSLCGENTRPQLIQITGKIQFLSVIDLMSLIPAAAC